MLKLRYQIACYSLGEYYRCCIGGCTGGTGSTTNQCAGGDVPTIYVDTASSTHGMHSVVGIGLANYEWFIQQIIDHQDDVKAGGCIKELQLLPVFVKSPNSVILAS
jgi:hypothetical protein